MKAFMYAAGSMAVFCFVVALAMAGDYWDKPRQIRLCEAGLLKSDKR